jgi:hypothetical protein
MVQLLTLIMIDFVSIPLCTFFCSRKGRNVTHKMLGGLLQNLICDCCCTLHPSLA